MSPRYEALLDREIALAEPFAASLPHESSNTDEPACCGCGGEAGSDGLCHGCAGRYEAAGEHRTECRCRDCRWWTVTHAKLRAVGLR